MNNYENTTFTGKIKRFTSTLKFRIPALMLLGMFLIGTAIITISYRRYEKNNVEKHVAMADGVTTLMAREFDVTKLDDYINYNYSSEEYDKLLQSYYLLKDSYLDVKYMYVYRFFEDIDGKVKAIVVVDLDEEYTKEVPQESIDWIGDIYNVDEAFANDYKNMVAKRQPVWHIVKSRADDGEVGKRLLSYVKPMFDQEGNYICSVCVDFSIDDMYGKGIDFIGELLIAIFIIGATILLGINFLLYKILFKPIKQITETITSFRYQDDVDRFYNVEKLENLNIQTQNEIDMLYNALLVSTKDSAYYMINYNKTQNELKEVNEVVSKDALTGVRSKSAYQAYIEKIEKDIANGNTKYAVVMVDINNLKFVNDTYGHDHGDEYIKSCTKLICNGYRHSPVFRIGGDEFVVILTGESYDKRDGLLQLMNNTFDKCLNDETKQPYERYTASLGMAVFKPGVDKTYVDMFVRADKDMYKTKQEFKKIHGSYR